LCDFAASIDTPAPPIVPMYETRSFDVAAALAGKGPLGLEESRGSATHRGGGHRIVDRRWLERSALRGRAARTLQLGLGIVRARD